ncbi:MAG: hypothetical protein NTV37_04600 [Proteobacteria bacterium]|nr:hypothetical protein [Pseudomonadota bacterium]
MIAPLTLSKRKRVEARVQFLTHRAIGCGRDSRQEHRASLSLAIEF